MAKNKKNRAAAFAVALISVAAAVAFVFACEKYPTLGEKVKGGIESIIGDRIVYGELPDGIMEVHIIDVGQADSILVRCNDGNVLIDAGTTESEYKLESHLDALDIENIDYFICTHPHEDHIGGADMVVREFPVSELMLMADTENAEACSALSVAASQRNVTLTSPTVGKPFTLGDVSLTVIGPTEEFHDENDRSAVIKLNYKDTSFLFMADAGTASESALINTYGTDYLDCDFLKVGHHGSDSASSDEFLNAVTPKIAVISCGKLNEYGHPSTDVLKRLEAAGCENVMRTDESGTIIIRSDGSDITVYAPKE